MKHPPLAAAWPFLFVALAHAQTGVRLVRVPDAVLLPAAAGSNLLLEVEVDGTAAEVWLATDLASRDRVPLAAAGERRWQLNLADARVATMLPAGRDGGELFVYATVGGATRQSAAVQWARATAGDGRVRCLVRRAGGTTTTVESGLAGVFARSGRISWLDLATTERIEVQGAAGRQSAVVARLHDVELPLQRQQTTDTWVLDGGKPLRERARDAETLEIEARLGARSTTFRFALVPDRLQLPDGSDRCLVPQRGRAALPGSRGWLRVHLGDITMGGTLLHVTTATGDVVVAPQVLHERDFVEFALADERYVLVVDDLVNLLVGDDHAELRVRPAAGFRPDPIGQLLRAIGASPDTFLREGKEYTGAAAQQFLIARLAAHRGQPPTVDDFVDTLASRSSRTGEPYHVRRQDGTTTTMQQWLRDTLRELAAKDPPARR